MKRLIFILLILASPCFAQAPEFKPEFIERDALMNMVYDNDVLGLEDLFAETHHRVSTGELPLSHLRQLNTWFIVSDPTVLAVTSDWLEEVPESIYAKVVLSFQISNLSWGIRGSEVAVKTYPEALARFDELREQAFVLAYEALSVAPGYVPASDAVILLNGTMQVFWSGEINSIIADTMALHPNFGTIMRAAYMHLPQWGGEGISGVHRLCKTYVPRVEPRDWLTIDTCIALLIWKNSFDEQSRNDAADVLSRIEIPGLEYDVYDAVIAANRIERMDEIETFLRKDGGKYPSDVALARKYVVWVYDTRGTPVGQLELDITKRAGETAKNLLDYDPFNESLLQTIDTASYMSGEPQLAVEAERDKLDLMARRVSGQPYNGRRWLDLGTHILFAKGFRESQPYMANAVAFGLQRAEISTMYVMQMGQHLGHLDNRLQRGEITEPEHQEVAEAMICEAKRVATLNEQLCNYDRQFYTQECISFSENDDELRYLEKIGRDFMQMAKRSNLSCGINLNATLEQTAYQPVTVDVSQFLFSERTFGTE